VQENGDAKIREKGGRSIFLLPPFLSSTDDKGAARKTAAEAAEKANRQNTSEIFFPKKGEGSLYCTSRPRRYEKQQSKYNLPYDKEKVNPKLRKKFMRPLKLSPLRRAKMGKFKSQRSGDPERVLIHRDESKDLPSKCEDR